MKSCVSIRFLVRMRPSTSRGPPETITETTADGNDLVSLHSSSSSTAVTATSLKSIKTVEEIQELEELTEEKRLRIMLGEVDTSSATNIYMREDYCGACGIQHPNYRLLDTYYLCESCYNCLRDHSHLRNRYKPIPQVIPLEICFATYGLSSFNHPLTHSLTRTASAYVGDVTNCRLAHEVTQEVQALVNDFTQKDRLIIRETAKLHQIFHCGDPVPGKQKQLRIRYRIANNHGFLALDIMENNQVPSPIVLMCPPERCITILRGAYGHPKGRTTTGRMSYDVCSDITPPISLPTIAGERDYPRIS